MLRDSRVGLIEPILAARETILSRCGVKPDVMFKSDCQAPQSLLLEINASWHRE